MSSFDLLAHLHGQAAFSQLTFGPGDRTRGVCNHLRKELQEVEAAADQGQPTLPEWIDVIILGFDGALRSGATPEQVIAALLAKQRTNESRTWPDWRTADPNKAIEHDRQGEEAATEMVLVSLEWLRGIQQRPDLILELQKKQKQRNTGMFL